MKFSSIKETSLYVKNLDRTEDFYAGKLKLEIISQKENRHIFFKAGSSVLLCFLANATLSDENLPHGAKGFIHIAFGVSQENYRQTIVELEKTGVEIIQKKDWFDGLESCYFNDPDGHLLEIVPKELWA
jgi:catechol 2,3-dioxygenase-like lactoylglutathione lyase family enzyme